MVERKAKQWSDLGFEDRLAEARRKVRELVVIDIRKNGVLSAQAKNNNIRVMMFQNSEYGEESVTNLLPPNSRQFSYIMDMLKREDILTKQDLINKVPDNSEGIAGGLGKIHILRAKFIIAMRDLAIAEMSKVSQIPPQTPQSIMRRWRLSQTDSFGGVKN